MFILIGQFDLSFFLIGRYDLLEAEAVANKLASLDRRDADDTMKKEEPVVDKKEVNDKPVVISG